MMRKLLIVLFLSLPLMMFSLPVLGQSVDSPDIDSVCSAPGAQSSEFCQDQNPSENPIFGFMEMAINLLSLVVGIAAVLGIIIGGFQMTVSGGDGQQTAKARRTVIYSLVGLVVAIFARLIVVFVINRL